jgi:hypothetical protein
MNHGHHSHSVHTTPGGGTSTTTITPVDDSGAIVPATAPAPTTVVVTTPPATAAPQTVSLGAMTMIAFGALLAGGAIVYFWPELVGQAEKVKEELGAGEIPNPVRRRKRKRSKR